MSTAGRSGLVLVGGRSSRMGEDKSRIELGGRTMLEISAGALEPLVDEILLLARKDDAPPAPAARIAVHTLHDEAPFEGPLPAIAAGLERARGSIVLAVACDMPLLHTAVLERIAELLETSEHDAVVPQIGGHAQPLCAAYRAATVAPLLRAAVSRGERSPLRALDDADVLAPGAESFRDLDAEMLSFRSVNDAADLAAVRKLLAQQGGGAGR